jgi:replication-associated protein G2P
MIDWLNIEVPLAHLPIKQGRRMVIDHDGAITSEFVMFRGVEREFAEGSYSSRVAVSSIDSDYTTAQVGRLPSGMVSGISVKGNPTKYLQGHNIFGISCIRTLARSVVADVLPKLGFSATDTARAVKKIDAGEYRVTKIDLTKMFRLGTDQDVRDYLRMMPFTVSARGDRCEFCKNTFYVGKHSGLWSLKIYNKFLEITSRSKSHRLPDFLPRDAFEQFTAGQLRVELVLQKQVLDRLQLTNPVLLQTKLNEVFNEFTGRITMRNQHIKEVDYMELGTVYRKTFELWRAGKDLKCEMANNTYYRHRRKFLELGIDISKPPIMAEDRTAIVQPIKVLAPMEVVEIPQNLQPYLLKVA